jgi:hypothetical protein
MSGSMAESRSSPCLVIVAIDEPGDVGRSADQPLRDLIPRMPLRMDAPQDTKDVVLVVGHAVPAATIVHSLRQLSRRDEEAHDGLIGSVLELALIDPRPNAHELRV